MTERQTEHGDTPDVFSDYAVRMLRVKAAELCRLPEFACDEFDDIEQELTLFLLQNAYRFDPQRSTLNTFINRVIRSRITTLLRSRTRKRSPPHHGNGLMSMETPLGPEDAGTIGNTLTFEDKERRLGRSRRDPLDACHLAIDVQAAIDSLPRNLKRLARMLMVHNQTETREKLNISQRSMARKTQAIREHFESRRLKFPAEA